MEETRIKLKKLLINRSISVSQELVSCQGGSSWGRGRGLGSEKLSEEDPPWVENSVSICWLSLKTLPFSLHQWGPEIL